MARKPVHLVFVEEKSVDGVDHNKFYDMFEKNGELHCYWGRRQDGYEFGKSGKLTVYPLSKWDETYNSKIRKGYEDKSYLYDDIIVTTTVSKSKDSSLYAPIPVPSIAAIIDRLQRYAKEVIDANYSVSSGQVTKIMIDETQKHLNALMTAPSIDMFNRHLKEIFKIIPRSMKRVDAYLAYTPQDMAKIIAREQDLLDIMAGQIITPVRGQKVETVKGDKKTILEINGIEMSEVNAEDIALIKRKLEGNANLYKNAWKITNLQQKKNYDKYLQEEGIRRRDTKLLWHGTRNENVFSILKSGLVLRPTNAVITGKMFGYGVYFAPQSAKSLNYTSLSGSYWAKGNDSSGFMILHEVAYGKPYDVYSFDSKYYNFDYRKLRNACPGANCLHAHGGTGMLRNDEIIVYKEEQLSALYLVELGR